MSNSVINDNRLNSSQDLVQFSNDIESIEENGQNRLEMIQDLPNVDHCDLSEVPKDYRNLIAFFLLGICNTILFYITSEYQIFNGHSAKFLIAIPIGIVKLLPMFISAFMNTRVIIWIVLNLTGVICMLISVCSDYLAYLIEYSSLCIILTIGFGEVICLSYSANFENFVSIAMAATITNIFESDDDYLDSDQNDQQKDHRNLISFYVLGLCNVYIFLPLLEFGTFGISSDYHQFLFLPAILFTIIKISPLFISSYLNIQILFWIFLNTIGVISILISIVWGFQLILVFSCFVFVLSTGIGEILCLSLSANFQKQVIAAFSAGQGSAALLCYIFTHLINSTSEHHTVIWVSLFFLVPIGQGVSYYVLLKSKRTYVQQSNGITEVNEHETPLTGFIQKICYMPKLLKYLIPLAVMYFLLLTSHQFLYHINQKIQTLDELLETVLSSELSHAHLVSSFGLLVGSLTVFLIKIESIWHLVAIQVLNIAYLIIEHFFLILASTWILYPINFWVSCLVGCAYVNTFYKIHEEIHPAKKSFALGITAIATSGGFILSGFLYIFFKNIIF